jgi:hypothetical protein
MKNWWWVLLMVNLSLGAAAAPTIGILQFGQGKPALQKAVRQAVPQAQVILVSAEDFAAGRVPPAVSVLIVPEAHRLPVIMGEPLQRWIKARKGTLFLSDAVPLQTWLYWAKGRWVERDEALKTLSTWRALWQASLPPSIRMATQHRLAPDKHLLVAGRYPARQGLANPRAQADQLVHL